MPKQYRVGVASLVHDHVWGDLQKWQAQPNATLVAVGDRNAPLRDKVRGEFGIDSVYESWEEMIAAEGDDLDIVHAAAENSAHADIVEACAAKGIHVITEKPMAATYDQAKRMVAAAEAAGTTLMVNWPTAWYPAFQELERLLLAGELGTLRYFKYRSAHNGPKEIGCSTYFYEWLYNAEKNGAGAYMDYCCYGAAMASLFLGRPKKVTGLRATIAKDYPLPDDTGLIAMEYDHAIAVAEASWTQVTGYLGPNPVAYGSEGSVGLQGDSLVLLRPGKAPETLAAPPLVAPKRNPAEYLLHCLENGQPITGVCNARVSLVAQEILQAGLRAADSGSAQTLPLAG